MRNQTERHKVLPGAQADLIMGNKIKISNVSNLENPGYSNLVFAIGLILGSLIAIKSGQIKMDFLFDEIFYSSFVLPDMRHLFHEAIFVSAIMTISFGTILFVYILKLKKFTLPEWTIFPSSIIIAGLCLFAYESYNFWAATIITYSLGSIYAFVLNFFVKLK